jgi:hypothetical protein
MSSPWPADEDIEVSPAERNSSRFWKALLAFIVLVGLAAAAYGYFLFTRPADVSVSLEFDVLPHPLLGEPFSLSLSVANQSDDVLHGAKLSIFLPQDVSFVGPWSGERVHEEPLGTIGPGSVLRKTFQAVAMGQAKTIKQVRAKFTYAIAPEGRVQFERDARADVQVGDPALSLSLEAPAQVVNGESFTTKIKYANASAQEFKNVRLTFAQPEVFRFEKASLEPASRANNVWNLGALKAGAEGEIMVEGSVVGVEGAFFTLTADVSADFLGESRQLASQTATLTIAASPLSVSLSVNESPDYIAGIGDSLQYTLAYRNNSPTPLRGISVSARLSGQLFDYATLRSQGSFNSLTNTVTWIAANAPELENLMPGEMRTLTFDVRLKPSFPITRVSDKNYLVKVEARVESPTVPAGVAAERTVSVAALETKVKGAIDVRAKALWRDAAWGFVNEGPYPPRAHQPTQFTVHWILTNYATDLSPVHMEAFVQSGAKFTGKAKSTVTTLPQYDAATGRVTWDIPSVPATRGVVGGPVEGVFQIEVLPSITQVGQSIPLMSELRVRATDVFTGVILEDTAPPLTTDIPEDTTVSVTDRRVQP